MFNSKFDSGNHVRSESLKRAHRGLFVCMALSVTLWSVPGAVLAGPESNPNLAKLEVKFFQHDFAKEDDVNARLERLEKMLFGEVRTGDAGERLKNLLAAVPNLDAKPVQQSRDSETAAAPSDGDDSSSPPQKTA